LTCVCPPAAPMVGEVPFFLGINYLKAMKASLDSDVQLQVLSKSSLVELIEEFPEDHQIICQNLWAPFNAGKEGDKKEMNLDNEKLLTKKRILESTNFRKEQQFNQLSKAARTGDVDNITLLARQGVDLDQV